MTFPGKILQIYEYLLENGLPEKIEAAIVLGSGLSGFTSSIENAIEIPYHTIPNLPVTSVQGHAGTLISGTVSNYPVLVFSGRFHHYEGFSFLETVLPVYLAKSFNAKKIIISNAAGAVNTQFNIGDLMVIDDIFRPFQKISALPSQKFTYNLYPFSKKTRKIASDLGVDIQRGSYLYVKGPNYETKAEITAFQRLGVDVVGMSTVPELLEAARLDIPAVAISLVTNMAAGLSPFKLDHSEVELAADSRKEDFTQLVAELVRQL